MVGKAATIFFFAMVLTCVSACSPLLVPMSTPDFDNYVKGVQSKNGQALVYVYRSQVALGLGITMRTKINNSFAVDLVNNTYVAAYLEPGQHNIAIFFDGSKKSSINLNVKSGEKYYVQSDFIFGRTGYLSLVNEATGSEKLKKCGMVTLPSGTEELPIIASLNNDASKSGTQIANQQKTLNQNQNIGFILPKTKTINKDAIAAIIGNKNYSSNNRDLPDVSFAHNDADMMKKYLVETLGYRDGNIIFFNDATQGQLVSTFGTRDDPKGTLYSWVRPGQSDVFVYYSGHGAPGLRSGKGFLLPVDANPTTVELNGYPLELLYQNLAKIPARSLTVVIDACFSGSSDGGSVVQNASSITLRRVEGSTALTNGVVFTAAGTDEVASWDKESKLGLFTRYFLEGVSGQADAAEYGNRDGQVTAAELKKYLDSEVSYMARRQYLREQHPQVTGNVAAVVLSSQ